MSVPSLVLVLIAGSLFVSSGGHAQSFPAPAGRVTDTARVIRPEVSRRLEGLLAQLEAQTGAEVAVVTLQTIAPLEIEQYANELFTRWGIGKRRQDNGVLILLAMTERKVRIEVGYGLEPILPDGRVGAIIREVMTPRFRQGEFGEGLYAGAYEVAQVVATAQGVTLKVEPLASPRSRRSSQQIPPVLLFLLLPAGFFVLHALQRNARRRGGGPPGFWVGGFPQGTHWSGGGFGGFSGGFGGFGGGSSGGGGASGSW